MSGDWLAPLMFVVVFVLIFAGFPVAFALGGTALAFAALGVATGFFDWALLYAMPERIFGVMSNYVLLAVPFFIFMGTLLERSQLAEDLLRTIGKLFGPDPMMVRPPPSPLRLLVRAGLRLAGWARACMV